MSDKTLAELLAEHRAKAEAAIHPGRFFWGGNPDEEECFIDLNPGMDDVLMRQIFANDPDTVLAMLDVIEAADDACWMRPGHPTHDELDAALARLREVMNR